jgi:ribonuclease VapC
VTWFIDASVIVAILGREGDWQTQSDRVDAATTKLWSAITQWESVAALKVRLEQPIDVVQTLVEDFHTLNGMKMVSIGAAETARAIDAHRRYGKSSGSPAKLNMGDCFAYACAKTNGARLLYKGNDFKHTDLA